MNQATTNSKYLSDHCRFLLMEIGIGVLDSAMDKIIKKVMASTSCINGNLDSFEKDVMLKALNTAYETHALYYSNKNGLLNFLSKQYPNKSEQLLCLEQLAARMDMINSKTICDSEFSVREHLQYSPAFQAKILCYGVTPPNSNHCLPVHPWLWRTRLKNDYYSNCLPCLNHKKTWYASARPFYLQDNQGNIISYYNELTPQTSTKVNHHLQSLELPYDCYLLTTNTQYIIPCSKSNYLKISSFISPFSLIGQDSRLIPFQSLAHPIFSDQLNQESFKLDNLVHEPIKKINELYSMQLKFYQFNPLIILKNGKFTGIIYRHLKT